jgi:hypothetical protein
MFFIKDPDINALNLNLISHFNQRFILNLIFLRLIALFNNHLID